MASALQLIAMPMGVVNTLPARGAILARPADRLAGASRGPGAEFSELLGSRELSAERGRGETPAHPRDAKQSPLEATEDRRARTRRGDARPEDVRSRSRLAKRDRDDTDLPEGRRETVREAEPDRASREVQDRSANNHEKAEPEPNAEDDDAPVSTRQDVAAEAGTQAVETASVAPVQTPALREDAPVAPSIDDGGEPDVVAGRGAHSGGASPSATAGSSLSDEGVAVDASPGGLEGEAEVVPDADPPSGPEGANEPPVAAQEDSALDDLPAAKPAVQDSGSSAERQRASGAGPGKPSPTDVVRASDGAAVTQLRPEPTPGFAAGGPAGAADASVSARVEAALEVQADAGGRGSDPGGTSSDSSSGQRAAAAAGATGSSAAVGKAGFPPATVFASGDAAPSWVERISERMRLARGPGRIEIRLELMPKGLGQIEVTLRADTEGLHAVIVAENEQTRALLANQQHRLEAALAQEELSLSSFDVGVEDGEAETPPDGDQPNRSSARGPLSGSNQTAEERESPRTPQPTGDGRLSFWA